MTRQWRHRRARMSAPPSQMMRKRCVTAVRAHWSQVIVAYW